VHLDKPGGKEVSSVSVEQKLGETGSKKSPGKIKSNLLPTAGVHDVYIVYQEPLNEKVGKLNTLFLEWIVFSR
jgi:hypothetical protein